MTDKQRLVLLREAVDHLEATKQGHVQWVEDGRKGPHWKEAIRDLRRLEKDLAPELMPNIGPVVVGGQSLLDHSLTHKSLGVPRFPAVDSAWGAGTHVIAPEDVTIDNKDSSAHPGEAFYMTGESGMGYWFAHLDRDHPLGKKFRKGDFLGKTVPTNIGGGPHGHFGVNGEKFLGNGKQFRYGRDGDGPDYSLGAPTIREQLRKALA